MSIDKKDICIIVLVFVIAVYLFSLHNHGAGADDARKQLEQIKQYQSDTAKRLDVIERGLKESADRVGSSTTTIINAERRIDTSQEQLRTGEQAIRESEQIIKAIRARGE